MNTIISYQTQSDLSQYKIGGKAANLLLLCKLGFNVPPFVVIPFETLQQYSIENEATTIIPQSLIENIVSQLPETTHFAVRSSAVGEDGEQHSYAGQFKTSLFVEKQNLKTEIVEVWKSIDSERVKTYTQTKGKSNITETGVIVQVMIDADVAGVAFGIHPLTGNRKEKVINAVKGVGEGLVSGEKIADSNLLSEKQVHEIENVLDKITANVKKYSEIEFAYKNNVLYVLQTRPITNFDTLPDSSAQYMVWDNSNIIESYPAVTSPLTFSFIIDIYNTAYRQLLALFGVSQAEIDENSDYFANMLGFIRSRVYYNLRSWYKILSVLPGYSINAEFMEKMMGVKEKFVLDDIKHRSKLTDYLRVVKMIIHLIRNMNSIVKQKNQFIDNFNIVENHYLAIPLQQMNPTELMQLFKKLEINLLKKWKAPLVNDFFAMIYFGVLQKLSFNYSGDAHLHNDLISGSQDIISTEPARMVKELSKTVAQNKDLSELFQIEDNTQIYNMLNDGKFAEFKKQYTHFIHRFGDRFVGELKLETITYTQQPENFIAILKSYVNQATNTYEAKQNEVRREAENKINTALKGKFIKKAIFAHVLRNARYLISNRENLRFYRTKAFGMVRNIFLSIGMNFKKENLIDNERDIFYLTKTEIFDFIKGTSVQADLKPLINIRKAENEQHKTEPTTANRIKTFGTVYCANEFFAQAETHITDGNLTGIGCSRGIVKGRVQVVHNPLETKNLNGDIMVAASTDPGWITLFPSASGIIVERGSLLSHSAIVSREMGIPCIVAVTNLLNVLKTGDYIEMDGSTGAIKVIEN